MNKREAKAVIEALENGRNFEFSNYYDGVREVLDLDRTAGCFTFTTYHAYDPEVETRTFSREELDAFLQKTFAYKDFHLPRVK